MVYKIKTLLKYLFIFVDQNETRRNVMMLFHLTIIIILQYFCFLSLSSGAASGRTAQFYKYLHHVIASDIEKNGPRQSTHWLTDKWSPHSAADQTLRQNIKYISLTTPRPCFIPTFLHIPLCPHQFHPLSCRDFDASLYLCEEAFGVLPLDTLERLAGTLLLYPYILTLLLLSGLLAGAALQNMRWVMAGQSSGLMGDGGRCPCATVETPLCATKRRIPKILKWIRQLWIWFPYFTYSYFSSSDVNYQVAVEWSPFVYFYVSNIKWQLMTSLVGCL